MFFFDNIILNPHHPLLSSPKESNLTTLHTYSIFENIVFLVVSHSDTDMTTVEPTVSIDCGRFPELQSFALDTSRQQVR